MKHNTRNKRVLLLECHCGVAIEDYSYTGKISSWCLCMHDVGDVRVTFERGVVNFLTDISAEDSKTKGQTFPSHKS